MSLRKGDSFKAKATVGDPTVDGRSVIKGDVFTLIADQRDPVLGQWMMCGELEGEVEALVSLTEQELERALKSGALRRLRSARDYAYVPTLQDAFMEQPESPEEGA